MINNKILYKRPFDDKIIEGRMIEEFLHSNEPIGTKNIALIFYKDMISSYSGDDNYEKMVFRYVETNDSRLQIFDEASIYDGNSKYDLIKNYGNSEYYIEDNIYNFVNYSGIKI